MAVGSHVRKEDRLRPPHSVMLASEGTCGFADLTKHLYAAAMAAKRQLPSPGTGISFHPGASGWSRSFGFEAAFGARGAACFAATAPGGGFEAAFGAAFGANGAACFEATAAGGGFEAAFGAAFTTSGAAFGARGAACFEATGPGGGFEAAFGRPFGARGAAFGSRGATSVRSGASSLVGGTAVCFGSPTSTGAECDAGFGKPPACESEGEGVGTGGPPLAWRSSDEDDADAEDTTDGFGFGAAGCVTHAAKDTTCSDKVCTVSSMNLQEPSRQASQGNKVDPDRGCKAVSTCCGNGDGRSDKWQLTASTGDKEGMGVRGVGAASRG